MRNKYGRLVSERGLELVEQRVLDIPLITVENYEKWYRLYVIQPNGEVETVPSNLITECDSGGQCIGHCWHPELVLKVAERLGGEVPATSLEMIAGRWVMERGYHDNIGYHLPSYYEQG